MLRDHINRVPKQVGKVITVDLTGTTPIIELLRLDGAVVRVAVNDFSASFRWPKEGELWSTTEENGVWILGGRVEDPNDTLQALALQPGETLIRGDAIYIENGIQRIDGAQAVLIDGTPNVGDAPTWNGTGWAPGAPAAGGAAGPAGGDLSGVYPNPTVVKAQAGFTVGGTGIVLTNDTRVPTQGENDALTGTSGAPSDTNRYVTNGDNRLTDARAPSGAAGGVLGGTYPNPSLTQDRVRIAGDTMTGKLTTPGLIVPSTVGAAKGRLVTLPSIAAWMGMTLNADFNGTAWVLDDTTLPGWFFKLDSRAGMQQFAVWKIPAGANPHADESAVFIVDVSGLITVSNRITGLSAGTGATDAVNKTQLDTLDTAAEKKANKGVANGYAPLDASSKVPVANLPAASPLNGAASGNFLGPWDGSEKWAFTPTVSGTYLITVAASAYSPPGNRNIFVDTSINGTYVGGPRVFANEASSHKALVPFQFSRALVAGVRQSFTMSHGGAAGDTNSDNNDVGSISIIGPIT